MSVLNYSSKDKNKIKYKNEYTLLTVGYKLTKDVTILLEMIGRKLSIFAVK